VECWHCSRTEKCCCALRSSSLVIHSTRTAPSDSGTPAPSISGRARFFARLQPDGGSDRRHVPLREQPSGERLAAVNTDGTVGTPTLHPADTTAPAWAMGISEVTGYARPGAGPDVAGAAYPIPMIR